MKSIFGRMACIGIFLLCACAPKLSKEIIESAKYGPPPPADYQEIIKADFAGFWIDPNSPIFVFEKPIKGFTLKSRIGNTPQNFGWLVCGTVNRRLRLGGYSGYQGPMPFFALFRNGRLTTRLVGQPRNNEYTTHYKINSHIEEICAESKKAAVP